MERSAHARRSDALRARNSPDATDSDDDDSSDSGEAETPRGMSAELNSELHDATAGEAIAEALQATTSVELSPEAAAVLAALPHASTPYLTCSRCNSVTFINVLRVRPRGDAKDESRLSAFEQLPICAGCSSTKYLRAGVVSFQEQIAEARIAIKEFERKRGPATALLQRIARGFLGRLEFHRQLVARERYLRLINRSATRIQTRVRGMQARRRALIERCLLIIRAMHASILTFALAPRPDRPPVFWYDSPAERTVLFWHYREFVRRSGGRPTLIQVETNVLEITRRMLLREYALVSRIQACWRGVATRLVFRVFKRERAWLRGVQQSPAIRIQRLFRGHTSRKRCRTLRVTIQYPSQLSAYCNARRKQEEREKRKAFRVRLLNKYRVGYQVDKTARMLALPNASASSEIGPETQVHMQHSLKHGGAAQPGAPARRSQLSFRNTQLRRRKANQHDDDDETDSMFSIREHTGRSGSLDGISGSGKRGHTSDDSDEGAALQQAALAPARSRNANSQRFADIKRKLERRRHGPRDPRTHVLQAQLYATPPSHQPLSSSHSPTRSNGTS